MNKIIDTHVTLRKVRHRSNFAHVGIKFTYGQLYICIYERDKLKSKLQPSTAEVDRPQHDHPNARCRPAVFFRHHRLTAFSFPRGKNFGALVI